MKHTYVYREGHGHGHLTQTQCSSLIRLYDYYSTVLYKDVFFTDINDEHFIVFTYEPLARLTGSSMRSVLTIEQCTDR